MDAMDLYLSEEDKAVRDAVREFVQRAVLPREKEIEETDDIPADLIAAAKDMGLFGVTIPEEYGGLGLKTLGACTVFEELGKSSWGFAIVVGANTGIGLYSLLYMGTPEQKQRYLPGMATGEIRSCFALTEPNAGSDASAIISRAIKQGDRWILNGQKIFITNAPEATMLTVFAKTDPSKGAKGISAFLVDANSKGLSVSPGEHKMGLHGCHTSQVYLDDVEVPAENLLGPEGLGYVTALKCLGATRLTLSARCCGAMERVISESLRHTQDRVAFGQPIANYQLVQAHLADMAVDHATARALVYQTAWQYQNGNPCQMETSMCKLYATEAFGRVADRGVQLFGGYGYIREYPVERIYRDARITRLFDGTSEIQRLVIAKQLLK